MYDRISYIEEGRTKETRQREAKAKRLAACPKLAG